MSSQPQRYSNSPAAYSSTDKENRMADRQRRSPRLVGTPTEAKVTVVVTPSRAVVVTPSKAAAMAATSTTPSTTRISTSSATKNNPSSAARTPGRTPLAMVHRLRAGLVVDPVHSPSTPTSNRRRHQKLEGGGSDEWDDLACLVGTDHPIRSHAKSPHSTVVDSGSTKSMEATRDSLNGSPSQLVRTLFGFEKAKSLTKFMQKQAAANTAAMDLESKGLSDGCTANEEPTLDTQPSPSLKRTRDLGRTRDTNNSISPRKPQKAATTPVGRKSRRIVDLNSNRKATTPMTVRIQKRQIADRRLASVSNTQESESSSDATLSENDESDDDDDNDKLDRERESVVPSLSHDIEDISAQYNDEEEHDSYNIDNAHIGGADEVYSRFFREQSTSKKLTSNNTLSKLPVLEPKEFYNILDKVKVKHEQELKLLYSRHQQRFKQWSFELEQGFNLLFYGFGSKRELIEEYATQCLSAHPILIVNGFFPTVSIRDILSEILSDVLDYTGPCGPLFDQVARINLYFESPVRKVDRLYLVIHNIDGINLRSEKTHTALSRLASCRHIHIIASVDHINSGLLWDTVKITRFNWLWQDATTFASYIEETGFENSMMLQQSELGPLRTLQVLRSLTGNVRKIYRILIDHQIAAMNEVGDVDSEATHMLDMEVEEQTGLGSTVLGSKRDAGSVLRGALNRKAGSSKNGSAVALALPGLSFQRFYQYAHEQFLTGNEVIFHTQLTEFRDHNLIKSRVGADGTQVLYIPLATNVLRQLSEDAEW
ncbi:hypothetical protein BASA50_000096 [Batrachochytrium salamandrivorans]|uniref:Origin recognition complex subunit 2 n=1 Tax=Batrachochytrium salamandrivorans TaxID=1357716 RepID=A0ABQ8EXW9_9FUNG|nr:hypothetical protein BASA60_000441 [Batrachochytrium salamandrivorans]KAH6560245.1 hypothetical protein BASA62_000214 [Batrachochytrium salamandrivorans]KAH6578879.1 hypothetical protein BASA61_000410 [Batrachochytrium salamandrivorans]KAH6587048.1 hypothetical protein BASA50_000096 [Batrachochytrium salamandrivorans]KAH9271539.1 hypothetical protein BASA83_006145 [Batrachochytrium salamandrivorans]